LIPSSLATLAIGRDDSITIFTASSLYSGEKLFFGRGKIFTFPDFHPNGRTVRKPRGTSGRRRGLSGAKGRPIPVTSGSAVIRLITWSAGSSGVATAGQGRGAFAGRKYHCACSRSVGAGKAAIRATRGLRYSVTRLMVLPLPATSRPVLRRSPRCGVARRGPTPAASPAPPAAGAALSHRLFAAAGQAAPPLSSPAPSSCRPYGPPWYPPSTRESTSGATALNCTLPEGGGSGQPLQWSRAVSQGRRDTPATPPRRVGAAAPGGRPGSAGVPRPP
jgi:hypothetical protein